MNTFGFCLYMKKENKMDEKYNYNETNTKKNSLNDAENEVQWFNHCFLC